MAESYEQALLDFEAADKKYQDLENEFLNGEFLPEMVGLALDEAQRYYAGLVNEVRTALEDRNVRLKNLADALRQKVVLAPSQWRGPEGKAQVLTVGKYQVSSVTGRSFNHQSLFNLAREAGLYERIMELTTTNKDGKEEKLVQEKWDIDFDGLYAWLKANKLQAIIDGAYDEVEKTPQFRGAKPLAFLGEKKDK